MNIKCLLFDHKKNYMIGNQYFMRTKCPRCNKFLSASELVYSWRELFSYILKGG